MTATNNALDALPENWNTASTDTPTKHWEHVCNVRNAKTPTLKKLIARFEATQENPAGRTDFYKSIESNGARNVSYTLSPRYTNAPRALHTAAACGHELFRNGFFLHTLRIPLVSRENLVGRLPNEALLLALTLVVPTLILIAAGMGFTLIGETLPFNGLEFLVSIPLAAICMRTLEDAIAKRIKTQEKEEAEYRNHLTQLERVADAFDLKNYQDLEPGHIFELERIYREIERNKPAFKQSVAAEKEREDQAKKDAAALMQHNITAATLVAAGYAATETGATQNDEFEPLTMPVAYAFGNQLILQNGVDINGAPPGADFNNNGTGEF